MEKQRAKVKKHGWEVKGGHGEVKKQRWDVEGGRANRKGGASNTVYAGERVKNEW